MAIFGHPFFPQAGGFAWNDLREIFCGRQRNAKVPNAAEILPKISTIWVRRTSVTDNTQTTDDRPTDRQTDRRTDWR